MIEIALRLMEIAVVPIILGVIAVWRRENKDQHDHNAGLLTHLSTQVNSVDTKIDGIDSRLDNVQLWQAEHEKRHMVDDQAS